MQSKTLIFIPTYNCSQYMDLMSDWIKRVIQHYDICIVDSSSTDGSNKKLLQYATYFKEVTSEAFDHGGTRSIADDYKEYEFIVFLTQDALPMSVLDIERLIYAFKDESIGAAYGRQQPYEQSNIFGKHLREFNYQEHSHVRSIEDTKKYGIKTAFLSNSFAAYRRSAMEEIGWFKSGLILGEDTYAGAKLLKKGYKLAYVSEAKVYHSHSYTVWEEFKRYFDIGVFHKMESWILEEFGKPEGEGMRYIKSEFNFLLDKKAYYKIPEFFVRNAMKFLGYKLGKHYTKLPRSIIKKISMHNRWWDKYWATEVKGL